MNAKQVLHNCEQSAASFFSLLSGDFLLNWMQNPQETQGTGPSSQCLVAICSPWKERHPSEGQGLGHRWRRYLPGISCLCSQRMRHVRLTETKHIPILSELHFWRKVFAIWSMYFVSKAGYPGRRNRSLKAKLALAGWLSWLEHGLAHQKVVDLISSQGTYLSCRFNPQLRCIWEVTDGCFSLSPTFLYL